MAEFPRRVAVRSMPVSQVVGGDDSVADARGMVISMKCWLAGGGPFQWTRVSIITAEQCSDA